MKEGTMKKGDWVLACYAQKKNRSRFRRFPVPASWTVLRPATEAEAGEATRAEAEKERAHAARKERETRQDWLDAMVLLGYLDHDPEEAIRKIGAARLRELVALFEEEQ